MSDESIYQVYEPITSNQAFVASTFALMKWYGTVVDVPIDEETGTVIVDESLLGIVLTRLTTSDSPVSETMLLSEDILRRDWDSPEEDEAWADL